MFFYLKSISIVALMILGFIGVVLSTLFHFVPNDPPSSLMLLAVGALSFATAFLSLAYLVNHNQRSDTDLTEELWIGSCDRVLS